MLDRILKKMLDEGDSVILEWLRSDYDADTISCNGVTSEGILLTFISGDDRAQECWSDQLALEKLSGSEESSAALWLLCRFLDMDHDVDSLLRAYVRMQTGLKMERVPFFLNDDDLIAYCDVDSCSSDTRESDQVDVEIHNSRVRVVVHATDEDVRDLLLGRLRRIVL